jgi:hypothetical protein
MSQRIEEFTRDGKSFIYFDLSEVKTNSEYIAFAETAKECIKKYAENSVLTITNIKDVRFDSETKAIIANWMGYNKPYVKQSAVIGFDGIKRMVLGSILKLSGRKGMAFVHDKEQAIERLLKGE